MGGLSTGLISTITSDVALFMDDACQVGSYTVTDDTSTPEPDTNASHVYGSAISCGVLVGTGAETEDGAQAGLEEVTFRLPKSTTITSKDRLRWTSKQGTALSASIDFAVLGEPVVGVAALIVKAKRIQGTTRL